MACLEFLREKDLGCTDTTLLNALRAHQIQGCERGPGEGGKYKVPPVELLRWARERAADS